ncbi:MAG: outer membrane protein assembly factor BamE [Alphaproteobacteria bacterium]|nr:outer membrane protein assembly factor BamE [Alphaproteobacteria bacterium]MBR6731011.1 outer membrane protein assembly factor BamE [Alphaproteobacteria bacterium]
MFKKLIYLSLLSGTMLLSACGLETYQSGDLPSQKRLNMITPGYPQEKVIDLLGSPIFENKIGNESFYIYFKTKKENRAFFHPQEIERDIYVISFNKNKTVKSIEHLTLEDGNDIVFDEAYTKVTGKELSVMEQLVKNFGRYDAGGRDSSQRQ